MTVAATTYRAIKIRPPMVGASARHPYSTASVSCCLCGASLGLCRPRLDQDTVIIALSKAGWHYTPHGYLHARAWCPQCKYAAAAAVA